MFGPDRDPRGADTNRPRLVRYEIEGKPPVTPGEQITNFLEFASHVSTARGRRVQWKTGSRG